MDLKNLMGSWIHSQKLFTLLSLFARVLGHPCCSAAATAHGSWQNTGGTAPQKRRPSTKGPFQTS